MLSKTIAVLLASCSLGCRSASPRDTSSSSSARPREAPASFSSNSAGVPSAAPSKAPPSFSSNSAGVLSAAPSNESPTDVGSPDGGSTRSVVDEAAANRSPDGGNTRAVVSQPAADRSAPLDRLLVIGDSLSDPRVGGGGYLRALLGHCPQARVQNLARGGFMVNQMRRRFDAEAPTAFDRGVSHVLVFGGVNDLYSDETAARSVEKIRADLTHLYRTAQQRGARVIAFTVAPWGGFSRYFTPKRAATTEQLNAWIREQSSAGLVQTVIDAHSLLSCGNPERLCPEYEHPFRDGLHFGKQGHARLGQALVEAAENCRL